MKKLILTGLGNEIDISTGKTIFTAIFNGIIRVPITEEGAKALTQAIYGDAAEQQEAPSSPTFASEEPTQDEPPQEEGEDPSNGIEDIPPSAYEDPPADGDGVESV